MGEKNTLFTPNRNSTKKEEESYYPASETLRSIGQDYGAIKHAYPAKQPNDGRTENNLSISNEQTR